MKIRQPVQQGFKQDYLEWKLRYTDLTRVVAYALLGDPRRDPFCIQEKDIVLTLAYRQWDRERSSLRMRLSLQKIEVVPSLGRLRRRDASNGSYMRDACMYPDQPGLYWIQMQVVFEQQSDEWVSLSPDVSFWPVHMSLGQLLSLKVDSPQEQLARWPPLMMRTCGRYRKIN